MSEPSASAEKVAKTDPEPPIPAHPEAPDGRKVAGKIVSVVIVFAALVLALSVWKIIESHPRTDDATVRANVVGIVPRVRGLIVKLNVQDNQAVKEGDVLFEIDPEDYELAIEKAKAARGGDAALKFGVKAAEAGVERAQAELKQADDTLNRLQPPLPKGFATAEMVDQARTVASSVRG